MGIKTYDPGCVHVRVGVIPISGFASENGITVSRNSDTFETVRGINGVVARRKSLDQSGVITLSLLQTSISNDVLSALSLVDEKLGSGIVPVVIIDSISKSVYVSAFAWVKKYVEAVYSGGLSVRQWQLECPELQMYTGGVTDADVKQPTTRTIVST